MRELIVEPLKTEIEIYFKRINPENLYVNQRPILESLKNYYEFDGSLSEKQVELLKKFKKRHDIKEREKANFNLHLNPMKKLDRFCNPAKPR